ncbi:MAG: hypothetical protein HYT68_00550 [Candidatus Zambryskibacteria bacterium]|nr:hypothetical protein [Candidatus Zambryskibacteria bacterium]
MGRIADFVLIVIAILSILLIAFAAFGQTREGGQELEVTVAPTVTTTGEVLVYVSVPLHPSNRGLAIVWTSKEGIGGSQDYSLNGNTDETRYVRSIWNLEDGEYVVHVILLRTERNGEKKTYERMSFFTVKKAEAAKRRS